MVFTVNCNLVTPVEHIFLYFLGGELVRLVIFPESVGVYIEGAFYVVTYSLSGKMQQIAKNPTVAISGEWFTAHGVGENLGHVLLPENREIMDILRGAFAAWYGNGHTNEADPNTCLLKISLTDGVLFSDGTRYDIDFT